MSAQQMTTIIVIVIVNRIGFLGNICILLYAFNHIILRSNPQCSPWQGGPWRYTGSESLPQKKYALVNPKVVMLFIMTPNQLFFNSAFFKIKFVSK